MASDGGVGTGDSVGFGSWWEVEELAGEWMAAE